MSGCCPVCKRSVDHETPQKPFCSDRCRLVDLGRWLDGDYRIPDPEPVDLPGSTANDEDGDLGSN